MKYNILILGTDINAYTMARVYHEHTGLKANLIGKVNMPFTSTSKICSITYYEDIYNKEVFKKVLKDFGEKSKNKIILIGTNDHYVNLITEYKEFLSKWYLFNYPSYEITKTFLDKSLFYEKYNKVFDMPKTFVYSYDEKLTDLKDFLYPLIIKPADGEKYFSLSFKGQNKVYKVKSKNELNSVLKLIKDAGYNEKLIIQEFIPGDDSKLFDSMFYVNKNSNAEYASFAQIVLQEHTKTGVGNCTLLINGFNEFCDPTKLVEKSKKFLEEIKYTGFAEFDFKYDERDKKFKLFEINPRQARCSYYFSVASNNLFAMLEDDLIKNKNIEFKLSKKKVALSFVPKSVIYSNVSNKVLLNEIKLAFKNKKVYNSLEYKKDMNLRRKKYLFLRSLNYKKKYSNKDWW